MSSLCFLFQDPAFSFGDLGIQLSELAVQVPDETPQVTSDITDKHAMFLIGMSHIKVRLFYILLLSERITVHNSSAAISHLAVLISDLDEQTQIEAVATFLIIFGAQMNVLFIITMKILMLITWSCRSFHLY